MVGKGAQATGMTAALGRLSGKADSRTWESFTRSGLKPESAHQEPPHTSSRNGLQQSHSKKQATPEPETT